MLSDLIDAYNSRLKSYRFLLDKVEREMDQSRDPGFRQFCDCESKRLRDLIQLCEQMLGDLRLLQQEQGKDGDKRLPPPIKKPEAL
ncbi:MAG: hypothetical protein KDI28_00910 [Pseudomonadales bacterium]|nr:hypothetical protein [Pseudomonadales bacterium]MCP5357457.1 hypothetical protein [Pseudomonadales bacterium]